MVFEGDGTSGRAAIRYVRLGRESEAQMLVEVVPSEDTEMVGPGDVVLVDGHRLLEDGTPVQLMESMGGASATDP